MAATLKMTHYAERAEDDKVVRGRAREYVESTTADRPMYHPVSRRMMRTKERRALALKTVTCKRCRKIAGVD